MLIIFFFELPTNIKKETNYWNIIFIYSFGIVFNVLEHKSIDLLTFIYDTHMQ